MPCPRLFWGIAETESDMIPYAIGQDGHDRGLWQYRDFYDAERGLKNPFDPVESTALARKEFLSHLESLGSLGLAVTAHRWGEAGARKHGIDREYFAKVKGYE